jgi:hypothetical protein
MKTFQQLPEDELPFEQYDEGLDRIERAIRRKFSFENLHTSRIFPFKELLDLSSVAGDNCVFTHIGLYPAYSGERPGFSTVFHGEDHEKPFRVALFVQHQRDSYMDPLDMSFKLKGLLWYPRAWEWLLEHGIG